MTDNDLWAVAREYDEQWPADTSNDAARMARLALADREIRDLVSREARLSRESTEKAVSRATRAEADLAAARAEVADRDRRLAAVAALAEKWEAADGEPVAAEVVTALRGAGVLGGEGS